MKTNKSELDALKKAVILIPSLEPDNRLPAYVRKLLDSGFGYVVVVDDGSAESYQPIFDGIAGMERTKVLHHDVNHGKGIALKTGYKWIAENLKDCSGVITADADGQHTVPDCIRLAEKLAAGERALYLGSRDFSLPNVPPRSKLGNRSTSVVFFLLYGKWLQDTQTGLRAFRREDLQFMIDVEGERFEYEMNVLIACARANLPMIPITIETVYENDNSGSHYNTWRDSRRIFKVIVKGFVKFMGVSILCFLIDQVLYHLLSALLGGLHLEDVTRIGICTYGARIVSATVNFLLNKNFVFKLQGSGKQAVWKYIILCVAIALLSAGGVRLLSAVGMAEWLAKPIVDLILYFVSYQVQQKWVFREGEKT